MTIRTYKVTLDTKNAIAPEPVFLRQGDKTGAVVIDATLMDNGAPVSIDGLTPMFKANTADGQAVIIDGTGFNIVNAPGGEFTYQVPNALSAVPGKIVTAYFSLSDASGSESTFDVAFVIKKAVDITKPQADEYITIIDGTLQSLQQKIDAMNTDVQTILDAFNQGDFYNRAQTDDKDAATLASAKSYADAGDATTLASAKSYADSGDSATLASANSYTNTQVSPITAKLGSAGQLLWSGTYMMAGGTTVTPTMPMSKTNNGWVLLWEGYDPSAKQLLASNFSATYVPAWFAQTNSGDGFVCPVGSGSTGNTTAKYVYVTDTTLKGNDVNNDSSRNHWALTAVIAM